MFGAFERSVAARYLRARKGERFVSFNAWFSLIGIALGVATLIIVMSVMNGFRQELLGRILGLNGHLGVFAAEGPMRDFDAMAERIRRIPGVVAATPIVEGQALITSESGGASGGFGFGGFGFSFGSSGGSVASSSTSSLTSWSSGFFSSGLVSSSGSLSSAMAISSGGATPLRTWLRMSEAKRPMSSRSSIMRAT